ncbi:MAG: D-alanyl-D-alanine carboxypeptidase/D-alanyl-D-alanine-endopeptidase [Nannocystaceae bacterium]
MSRLLRPLAAFTLAALVAHAGLATADAGDTSASSSRSERRLAALERPAETILEVLAVDEAGRWRALIDGRLAALRDPEAATASAVDEVSPADAARLRGHLTSILARSGARVAVHVRDVGAPEPLFDRRGDARLNPASNQKVLTSIAAAELLGADYRFETRVVRAGAILYLIGEGDPSLQERDLHDLAAAVIARGAHRGVEAIVVDDSAFSPEQIGPGYHGLGDGASYEAPSGALSLAFNTVEVRVTPGPWGEPAIVRTQPASAAVVIDGVVKTGRGRPLAVQSGRDGERTRIRVDGAIAGGKAPQSVRRRVGDPGLFTGGAFATILAELTEAEPLPVRRGLAPAGAPAVVVHRSAPLSAVLASALKYSNNFTTEQVLRTLGWRASGEPGSWENGAAAIRALWVAVGNDAGDLAFENGSGLSSHGRVTPRGLVRMLELTQRTGSHAAELLPAFAGPGGEGTLRLRMPRASGRVRGKTGTIGGVSALSGLVAARDGRRTIAFSILINGPQDLRASRRIQDQVVLALVDHLDRG